jgi:hypothetical protein
LYDILTDDVVGLVKVKKLTDGNPVPPIPLLTVIDVLAPISFVKFDNAVGELTVPYSKAVAPAFTFNTWLAVPIAVKPVPPLAVASAVVNPVKSASHEAAVVPVIKIQVITAVVLGVTVATKLEPDEFTVTMPVELLCIVNC